MSSTPITYIEFGAYRTVAIESSLRSAKLLQAVKLCPSVVAQRDFSIAASRLCWLQTCKGVL